MRPDWRRQVETGRLVCPRTRARLALSGDVLVTPGGDVEYPVRSGVPILLADQEAVDAYLSAERSSMQAEYAAPPRWWRRAYAGLAARVGDMRPQAAQDAFGRIFSGLGPDSICVSIGGGPTRANDRLINLNLAPFTNVDLVADAYHLPYADGSVDAVHIEAVLEHLELPDRAMREIARVLAPGRLAFVATPFLQVFHGYPDHFQNFTTSGHRRLVERAGLEVVETGTCVGATFAMRDIATNYLRTLLPGGRLGRLVSMLFAVATIPTLFVDRWLNTKPQSSRLASSTYLLARKPAPGLELLP